MSFRELKLQATRPARCAAPNRTIHALIDYEAVLRHRRGRRARRGAEGAGRDHRDRAQAPHRRRASTVQLVDVREPHEAAIARIPGARLVPLGEVVARAGELDPRREAIVHCKAGTRSAKAIAALREAGTPARW